LVEATLHPGDLVADRFEIDRCAASGGTSIVYRAHDRKTHRPVAVKILRDRSRSDGFQHQADRLAALDHPHIIQHIAHGLTPEDGPFVVMPWLDGVDLQQRLFANRLSVSDTLTIAAAVADALAYLHERGIVHRDLTPGNLFLPDGQPRDVKVIDLGIGRTHQHGSMLDDPALVGTPGFIAPEQARGGVEPAPSVDIFAFGCVLFECLTGERLYGGTHRLTVLAKTFLEEPRRTRQLRADVPEALDQLIYRMVARDPARRPQTGAELREWLVDQSRAGDALSSHPPTSLTGRERRVLTILVFVLPSHTPPPGRILAPSPFDAEPFHPARFGVHLHRLDGRTAVAFGPDGLGAGDQACVLARFGATLHDSYPGARIAMAAGSVITGPRPPVGEAIERAMEMVRSPAPPQGILLDDLTAALVASRFDIRREGAQIVLDEERLSLDPTRTLLGRATSCMGREPELRMLEERLAEAVSGNGPKVVVVKAAAGAGKSRLRHEFTRRLRSTSAPPLVLQCHGDPLHLTTPFAQLAQIIRQAMGLGERERPEVVGGKLHAGLATLLPAPEVTRVAAFLGELVGCPSQARDLLPLRAARGNVAAMEDQIRHAFEDVVRAWCLTRPVVLVFEDLQWCDTTSVKLVDGALRRLDGERLLVLALARPEVEERFPALWESRSPAALALPPLPRAACVKLVRSVIGGRASSDDVRRIVDRSQGNAFCLEELTRAAAERSLDLASLPPRPLRDELPETVIAVAQARLERLDPEARKVLRAASVFGVVFSLEGVGALLGVEPSSLERIHQALLEQEAVTESELLRTTGSRELAFRHALLRAAAYASLTEEDRRLGHRLAALWLAAAEEDSEVVALHWLEAGDRVNAAECFASAGRTLWKRAQADAAARCAARSLLVADLEQESEDVVLSRIRLLGDALEATRRIDTSDVTDGLDRHLNMTDGPPGLGTARTVAHAALERAMGMLKTKGDKNAVTTALARSSCALAALSDFEGARRLLAEATACAGADEGHLQSVRHASAKVAFWMGEYGLAVETLSGTLLPTDWRERLEILLILATAVVSIDGREALARGLDYVSRAEALVGESGEDPSAQVRCMKARMLCFFFAGQYGPAAEAAEAAVVVSQSAGLRYEECINIHNAGELYIRTGDAARGCRALVASSAIARDIGADALLLFNEALLAYVEGRSVRIEEIANQFRTAGDPWHEMHIRYWLGHLLASHGAPAARRELEVALSLARKLKVRSMGDDCLNTLASLTSAKKPPPKN
jgi:eukaryotic-like serine/threonine-protein kinase